MFCVSLILTTKQKPTTDKGIEKDTPCKWKPKGSSSSYRVDPWKIQGLGLPNSPPCIWKSAYKYNQPSTSMVPHPKIQSTKWSCSNTLCSYWKKMHISRLMQFKPVSFKGQLYLYQKKIDFKPKTIKWEDRYIMILGSINQED